jgi:tRNA threonylcarbamoyladenosine biosynthesis protein TsaB
VLILAFDTSGLSGSVALLEGPRVLGERELNRERRSAQTLIPAIVDLLASQQVRPQQIGLIAVTQGPGSFTGLRVGITAAKTFAYSVGSDVLALSTLEVIAHQIPLEHLTTASREIHAVVDAQRRELFVARFSSQLPAELEDGLPRLMRLDSDCISAIDSWAAALPKDALVIGPGLDRVGEAQIPTQPTIVARPLWEPHAATVGRLAWRAYQRGRRDDLWKLAPEYLRPSYAEEKAKRGKDASR